MVNFEIWLLFMLFAVPTPATSTILASDQISILLEFLKSLRPLDDTVLSSWNNSNNVCESWDELTCNPNGQVTELYLSTEQTRFANNSIRPPNLNSSPHLGPLFSGVISPIIYNLTSLKSLTLTSLGNISGPIPSLTGKSSPLTFLNISGNKLSGEIPATLSIASNLQIIDAHGNQLKGPIPQTLATLNLTTFDVSHNAFNGSFPAFFSNQTSLTYLSISENDFSGTVPSFLPLSNNLTYLNLASNGFSGLLSPAVCQYPSLEYLNVSRNNFVESFPSTLGSLTSLISLDIGSNQFSLLPNNFTTLTRLQFLFANNNLLSGSIPSTIASLANLQTLDLSNNALNGSIPDYFGSLVNLRAVVLSYNLLTGAIPASISGLKNLQTLDLSSNQLNSSIPDALQSLSALQTLALSSNRFNGSVPSNFPRSLRLLDLSNNQFTASIPSALALLSLLRLMDLSFNQLNGTIPASFGALASLRTLDLSSNALSGAIPSSIGNLTALTSLAAENNQLSGPIPAAVGSLPNLASLLLANNSLTGSPLSFLPSNQKLLTNLSLSFNSFDSQNLTSDIGLLTALLTFRCRSCNLIGSIPASIKNLSSLFDLDLSVNSFTGTLDLDAFQHFPSIAFLSISGSSILGSIPSLAGLTNLQNLDLSFNQFDSALPAYIPPSIVSLNLAGNHLNGQLSSAYFSSLTNLDILEMDDNLLVSGPVPTLPASVVSFANTAVSGTIPASYAAGTASQYSFFNSPACNSLHNSDNVTVCQSPSPKTVFSLSPPCNASCYDKNLPSPYLYSLPGRACVCSGYVVSNLTLGYSAYAALTTVAAGKLQSFLASALNVPLSTVWIPYGVTGSDAVTTVTVYLFGTTYVGVPGYLVAQFLALWPQKSLVVPRVGVLSQPMRVSVNEFASPPPPPPAYFTGSAPSSSGSSGGVAAWLVAVIVVALTLLLLAVAALLAFALAKRRPAEVDDESVIPAKPHYVPRISLLAISAATDGFSEGNQLGSGGYGDVFRGVSADGVEWAVKRARSVTERSLAEFETELDILSKVSHTNVVRLLGYCDTKSEQILVYEYMNSGTLKAALHYNGVESAESSLSLKERVEVSLGAAEGLRYLHSYAEEPIIHRDIKSDNILLNVTDRGIQAKIADFGLLKQNSEELAEVMNTRVAGTTGYIDPEYYNSFKATRKSDVYSFGVVMLELITGLPAIIKEDVDDDGPDEQVITSLANWVQPFLEDSQQLLDPRLGSDNNQEAVDMYIKLAKSCIERSGKYRPFMDEVCIRLHGIRNLLEGVSDETRGENLPSSEASNLSTPMPLGSLPSWSQTLSDSFFAR